MPGFDLKKVNRNDQVILGAGILVLIVSLFFPWYTASASAGIFKASRHYNAWQGFGILGILLLLAAAGIVAARVFAGAKLPTLPLGANVIVAGAAALGTVLILLEWLIFDPTNGYNGPGISQGLSWGGYLLLVIALAETYFAYMNMKASGEKIAWDSTAMPRGAAAGGATPDTTVPPQGMAPSYPPPAEQPAYPPASSTDNPGTPGV
jgi:hypothetical protein